MRRILRNDQSHNLNLQIYRLSYSTKSSGESLPSILKYMACKICILLFVEQCQRQTPIWRYFNSVKFPGSLCQTVRLIVTHSTHQSPLRGPDCGGRRTSSREPKQAKRPKVIKSLSTPRNRTLNLQNQTPHKIEVQISSFCSIWFGID